MNEFLHLVMNRMLQSLDVGEKWNPKFCLDTLNNEILSELIPVTLLHTCGEGWLPEGPLLLSYR